MGNKISKKTDVKKEKNIRTYKAWMNVGVNCNLSDLDITTKELYETKEEAEEDSYSKTEQVQVTISFTVPPRHTVS